MHCGETKALRTFKAAIGSEAGIDSMEVEAYERGEKRMSCKILLETAKQLNTASVFLSMIASSSR
jgi:hypothetical protein